MRCFSETAIRSHRGPIWRADTTLATRTDGYFGIKIGIDRAMAFLTARIHIFRRRESKPTKSREKEKLITLSAGSGVQDNFDKLTIASLEGQADDVYQQTVRALNAYFHMQENAAYKRYVLR